MFRDDTQWQLESRYFVDVLELSLLSSGIACEYRRDTSAGEGWADMGRKKVHRLSNWRTPQTPRYNSAMKFEVFLGPSNGGPNLQSGPPWC